MARASAVSTEPLAEYGSVPQFFQSRSCSPLPGCGRHARRRPRGGCTPAAQPAPRHSATSRDRRRHEFFVEGFVLARHGGRNSAEGRPRLCQRGNESCRRTRLEEQRICGHRGRNRCHATVRGGSLALRAARQVHLYVPFRLVASVFESLFDSELAPSSLRMPAGVRDDALCRAANAIRAPRPASARHAEGWRAQPGRRGRGLRLLEPGAPYDRVPKTVGGHARRVPSLSAVSSLARGSIRERSRQGLCVWR
jgi:hypothetical protein